MTRILVYNNGQRVGETSKAFDIVEIKELLAGWTLKFGITNTNNIRQYVIDPSAVYEIDGQQFDLTTYDQESGSENCTTVTAMHISDHLNNYTVPAGYSYVGTAANILNNILTVSGASAEHFVVGIAADVGTQSFVLGNTQEMSARTAIVKLRAIGVEASFNNFSIDLPVRWGADTGKVFKFGRDLCSLKRAFSKATTPWTYSYEIDIANLQRLPGGSPGDEFGVGDTIGVQDDIIGDVISGKRIVLYEKHHDNATLDKITFGQFMRDSLDDAIAMQVDISKAAYVANHSVHVGESYNSVKISNEKGFESISGNGITEVFMNGTDGFCGIHNDTLVLQLEPSTGKFVAYNLSHTQKVELGGDYGLTMWKSSDGENWTQVGGMDADSNLIASRLQNIGSGTYGVIGIVSGALAGLQLVYDDGKTFFDAVRLVDGGVTLDNDGKRFINAAANYSQINWENSSGTANSGVNCDSDGTKIYKNGAWTNANCTVNIGPTSIHFTTGICDNVTNGGTWDGTFNPANATSITVVNGMITKVQ